jgi:anti-sigma regulatory factor (Ser/Thr protein kinase)
VADARATHPVVWEADRRYRSDQYDPDHVVARYNRPLDKAPDTVTVTVVTAAELAGIRRFARDHARHAGVSADRIVDVELIITELVTNSLAHTQGPCWVRIWSDQNHLTCEVRDTGHLTDPLAGRRPRPRRQRGGRGLLLVNSLADLVRTHTTAAGTTIRAMLRLGVPG